ncbi:MAG: flagellar basal body-associated FliL family protein [Chitinivibrionales bacterium]|nr:flagellar basal body-associated FliL family protein [Chitinivibrionales bacterium]
MNKKPDEKAPAPEREKGGEDAAAPAKKKPANMQQIIFLGIIVGVVVLNTIIALVLVSATRPKRPDEKAAEMKADSLKATTEAVLSEGAPLEPPIEAIVNIAGTDGERFLKVVVVLWYDKKKYPKMGGGEGGGMKEKAPMYKDMLIEILSPMTLPELNEPDVKDKIRKNLLRMINNTMSPKEGEISNVLIDQFIIQ